MQSVELPSGLRFPDNSSISKTFFMKKLIVSISAVALMGCAKSDSSLEMDLAEIRVLCDAVSKREAIGLAGKLSDSGANAASDGVKTALEWTKDGSRAECELEYRIKQQEAKNTF